ncbi:BTAD domain-containing putative transcriptional regulator [Amycolatopsis sp. NPDC004625]|uniref:AfsR/SARP family transcriptional regulator n=1 Tax=Amycolatopsis sp. NPDC004625 TaxID=3154670 RepID=UPI0033B78EEC
MELKILGSVELRRDGQKIDFKRAKERFLLGVLAMRHGKLVSTQTVIEALWDDPPRLARKTLQAYVSRLRKTLRTVGASAEILTHDGGYTFFQRSDTLDYLQFQQLVRASRAARETNDLDGAAAALEKAVALWRGEVVSGLDTLWMEGEREDLEDRELLPGYQALCTIELNRGNLHQVLGYLEAAPARHEQDVTFAALRLSALNGLGHFEDFDACWRQIRDRCAESYGTSPPRELQEHYRKLLQDRELVEHADYRRTQAALRAIPPAQLPLSVSEFVDRAGHLTELEQRLIRAHMNGPTSTLIVVITGPVGVGKSQLGLRWGHMIEEQFPDGQLYADLSGYSPTPARNPDAIVTELLESFGVAAPDLPSTPVLRERELRTKLAGRRVLIFLDNALNSEQVTPLLPGSAASVVIVTSRHRLTDLVNDHGAYRLVVERFTPAETASLLTALVPDSYTPASTLTAEAASQLTGGLPRAIRLLADALTTTTSTQPPRPDDLLLAGESDTRTLLASIVWSYDRLSAGSARTFRTLSMHIDPTLSLAAATALDGTSPETTRRHLKALSDLHLVDMRGDGYSMDTLTRAAGERLAIKMDPADTRARAKTRLLDWTATLATHIAETLSPTRPHTEIQIPDPDNAPSDPYSDAKALLECERASMAANVRRAASTHLGHAVAILRTLRPHLEIGDSLHDWHHTHEIVLAAAVATHESGSEAEAHAGLAQLHHHLGNHDATLTSAYLATTLFRAIADQRGLAEALLLQATHYSTTGEHDLATARAYEALTLQPGIDEPALAARTRLQLGIDLCHVNDLAAALEHLTAAEEGFQRLPDHRRRAQALLHLGRLTRRRGLTDVAATQLQKAAELHTHHPADHAQTVAVLLELSEVSLERRDYVEAVLRGRETVGLCRSREDHVSSVRAHVTIVRAHAATGRQDEAWAESRRTLDLIEEIQDQVNDYVREHFTRLGLWPD